MAKITQSIYGTTKNGEEAHLFKLENNRGSYVTITDFGGTILSLVVPDKNGTPTDIVLGYDCLETYEIEGGAFFGALIGRCGNRIANGQFTLNGTDYHLVCNNSPNHLHGGPSGFSHRMWNASIELGCLKLILHSADGEEGYPGNVTVTVTYTFGDDNNLSIHYEAVSDADTIVNLTNHSYFNLNGHGSGSVEDHMLKLFSSAYTPTDATLIPTGEIRSVTGTPFDFRTYKRIGKEIHADDEQIRNGNGYDHNFVLDQSCSLSVFAEAYSEQSGIYMKAKTTLPGVQFYTGNFLDETIPAKDGAVYHPHQGFALETQVFPDAIHHENFPPSVLRAGMKYNTVTTYEFSIKE